MHATYDGLIGTFGVVLARFREARKQRGFCAAVATIAKLFLQVLMTPVYALTMGRKAFCYNGKSLRYFCHWYNTTFLNERAVEVAAAIELLKIHQGKNVLEIGNVLSHYTDIPRQVLDKYEKGEGVIHEDIVDFHPDTQYDLIVSVSTLEHVGFDETPKDPAKFARAVRHVKTMLKPGGTLFVTIPVGYNPGAVRDACEQRLFSSLHFLKHISARAWQEVAPQEALTTPFGSPFQFANAVIFCLEER